MHKIKITNILQGKVVLKNDHYAIGFVTNYGIATIRMFELDKFLDQNPHLKDIMKGSVVDSEELIGKFIYVKNKQARYTTCGGCEIRIKVF